MFKLLRLPVALYFCFCLTGFAIPVFAKPPDAAAITESFKVSIVSRMLAYAGQVPTNQLPFSWNPAAWTATVRNELIGKSVRQLEAIETNLREVFSLATDRGMTRVNVARHIVLSPVNFLRMTRATVANVFSMMEQFGLTSEQVNDLFLRDFVAFALYPQGIEQALQHHFRLLSHRDARDTLAASPQTAMHYSSQNGMRLFRQFTSNGWLTEKEFLSQTQQRASLGIPFLFNRTNPETVMALVASVRDGGYLYGTREVSAAYLKERMRYNLWGFLAGDIGSGALTQLPALRKIAGLFAEPKKVATQIRTWSNANWDMEALNTIDAPNFAQNWNAITTYLYAALPDLVDLAEEVESAVAEDKRSASNYICRGELVIHRLSDIPAAKFAPIFQVLTQLLNPYEMAEFFALHKFTAGVLTLQAIARDLVANPNLKIRAELVKRLPNLRDSESELVKVLKAQGPKANAYYDALEKLSQKGGLTIQTIDYLETQLQRKGVGPKIKAIPVMEFLHRAKAANLSLPKHTSDHGMFCYDVVADMELGTQK